MKRRSFIQQTTLAGAGLLLGNKYGFAGTNEPLQFPVVRTPADKRNFTSEAVEKAIKEFSKEPASKPREQFEAEIDAIVHLIAYTKCLYPTEEQVHYIPISPIFSSF